MVRLHRDEGFSIMNIIWIVAAMMIMVGILIPLLAWRSARAKISEPMKNLAAICAAQNAYKAKYHTYHPCKESPANGGTDDIPDPWVDEGTPGTDAFADVGFKPEGQVRYRYAVIDATTTTFIATATGDLDGDGKSSVFTVNRASRNYPKPGRSGDRW